MKTTKPLSDREALARAEIGVTAVTRSLARFLTVFFLTVIAIVPLGQHVFEIAEYRSGQRAHALPQAYDIFRVVTKAAAAFKTHTGNFAQRILHADRLLVAEIGAFETALEEESVLRRLVLPPAQYWLTRLFDVGNEKAYVGRERTLFFRPDVDYVIGRPFFPGTPLAKKADADAGNADSIAAILHFRDQLASRGIELILFPTPLAPMIHPQRFAAADGEPELQNPSYEYWLKRLEQQGVIVFDFGPALARRARDFPQFLRTDTHWLPPAVESAAAEMKALIDERALLPPLPAAGYVREPSTVTNLGDVAQMLRLPADQDLFPRETVTIQRVTLSGGNPWARTLAADVLVLGDSFSNIYSLDALGWGTGAGFVEQLSFALQRPVDAILRNDGGAHATREMLARELDRGKDRLAGKKLVIWQFAMRELASGDWKKTDLVLGEARPSRLVVPPAGTAFIVTGTIEAKGPVPRPRTVPYKDHIVALHLTDLKGPNPAVEGGEAIVYCFSMVDNVLTAVARLRAGDSVTMRLQAWSEVEAKYGAINRSELADDRLQLEEPAWGDLIP